MSVTSAGAAFVWPAIRGDVLSREALAWVRRGVSGVVLELDQCRDASAIAHLVAELKRRAERPLLVAVSHEGGDHAALRHPFVELPAMGAVGLSGELKLATAIGTVIGRELRALGVDLNFAPVLDVDTREDNPLIAGRSFGISPHVCGAFGAGWVEAMQAQGVAACGKHYPGLGEVDQDPRRVPVTIDLDPDRMHKVELPPFFTAIDRGMASVLVGHAVYPRVDEHPASRSAVILDGWLRGKMHFAGPAIADDLSQPASRDDPAAAAVECVAAGIDAVRLTAATPDPGSTADAVERTLDALDGAIASRDLDPARVQHARRRIAALTDAYVRPLPDPPNLSVIASDEHRVIMEQVWRLAETQDTP